MHLKLHTYRHNPYDQDYIKRLIAKSIPMKIGQCLTSAGEFETLIEFCTGLIYSSIQQKIQEPKIIQACSILILETIRNNFELALSPSPEVQIQLSGKTSTIKKVKHNNSLFYGGYYYSFIFRSTEMKHYLDLISYQKYLVAYTDYDLFNYSHYVLLRSLGKQSQKEQILNFNNGFKNLYAIPRSLTENMRIFYPLWEFIIREDNKRFNEKLEESLLMHQKLWSQNEENPDIENSPRGHRNIFLTGIMSYAKDMGFHIDHTSDYTPQYLVYGTVNVDLYSPSDFTFTPIEPKPDDTLSKLLERFKKPDGN